MNILKSNLSKFFFFPAVWPSIGVILICLGMSSFLGMKIPELLIQFPRNYEHRDLFLQTMKVFGLFIFGVYIIRSIYQLCLNKYIKLVIAETRNLVFKKWLLHVDTKSSLREEREYPQGEIIARIMSDSQAIRELITSGALAIFIDIFFVVSFLFSFVRISQITGTALVIAEVLAAFGLVWGGKYMRSVFHSVRKAKGMVGQSVANVVGGLEEMYYTDHQNYASKTAEVSFTDFLKKQLKANVWDASYYSLAESLYPIFLAMVVLIFPYSKITEAAIILALVESIQRSINPIKSIAGKIANIQRAATGIQRIGEFTDDLEKGHVTDIAKKVEKRMFRSLEVEVPYFSYNNRNEKEREPFSLQNINFRAKRGELFGIVGLSGSGKSTLLNIIAGHIILDQGHLFFEGGRASENLYLTGGEKELFASYREQVGIVSQDSHIFSAPLSFNITLKESPDEDFYTFWNWIQEKIPYLKSWGVRPKDEITPRGLSLGQNQLICAIRSCYLKKTIVLFDEISSGLDSQLESALREVILLIQGQSLTFIVAHRLETIMGADKILVLEGGKLVSEGSHLQLLGDCQVYRDFIEEMTLNS
ncbi:ABC transporter ATP-binding protein/permease [Bacteriovoracales bacterium]|nr:ABC transporter ATP-binding protein/permease [Bacteriovoracales bacterium]